MDDPFTLVSTGWLADNLKDADLRILDGSWYLPQQQRDAVAEFSAAHIPGARFFDIDEIADLRSDLPHMLPSEEKFISRMRAMGVGDGHQVVVYDGAGLMTAARVWWTFKVMGHDKVAVLDGGLPKWQAEGRPVTDAPPVVRDRHMIAQRRSELVAQVTDVAGALKLGESEVIDARAAERFRGDTPEPREGLRAGHMPGAHNVPWPSLLAADGTLLPPERLRERFVEARVDLDKPAITTCGSGVSAALLNLALQRIGKRDHALYDGSWAEWGMYGDLAVVKGEA